MNRFAQVLARIPGGSTLTRWGVTTVQINLGLECNLACRHCHLEAAPTRTERMSRETMTQLLATVDLLAPAAVELTGGAPERHPHFRWLVSALRERGVDLWSRTNLAVLMETELAGTAEFLREQGVRLVASLPCYLADNVDRQRGAGSFARSMAALERLNRLGYGQDPRLTLDLVYNPATATLPPPQRPLEAVYRRELSRYNVVFNRLLTITNQPIGRFRAELQRAGALAPYQVLLEETFNPLTLDRVMCRTQISIGWDGLVFDCDFNLALAMPAMLDGEPLRLDHLGRCSLEGVAIMTGDHCFACTAGAGSSCLGALTAG